MKENCKIALILNKKNKKAKNIKFLFIDVTKNMNLRQKKKLQKSLQGFQHKVNDFWDRNRQARYGKYHRGAVN